ncbi:MAG: hypothetical protein KC910_14855 [Candidatus Eremiobacteraeota bacterium]|nr:hypothetical protein [Candidatus Eremiobacteraeota bacterium]
MLSTIGSRPLLSPGLTYARPKQATAPPTDQFIAGTTTAPASPLPDPGPALPFTGLRLLGGVLPKALVRELLDQRPARVAWQAGAVEPTPWLLAGAPVEEPTIGPRFDGRDKVEATPEEETAELERRGGMRVKADQYPGIDWLGDNPDGTPSYRRMGRYQATGQPTVDGLRKMLDKSKKFTWVNMREEPVVYIQGKPYNMRLDDRENHSTEGESAEQVARREQEWADKLKAEIEAPPKGYVLLHEEVVVDGKPQTRPVYVKVKPEEIQTPTEVVTQLKSEGYQLDYHRVPVTDEHAPEAEDFDRLREIHDQCSLDSEFIVNCHGGRGRTTTALTVFNLLDQMEQKKDNPAWAALQGWVSSVGLGEVLKTVKGLVSGSVSLEKLIDELGKDPVSGTTLVDLREQIGESLHSDKESKRKLAPQFAERFARLLLFAVYLNDEASKNSSFDAWLSARPELEQALTRQQLQQ